MEILGVIIPILILIAIYKLLKIVTFNKILCIILTAIFVILHLTNYQDEEIIILCIIVSTIVWSIPLIASIKDDDNQGAYLFIEYFLIDVLMVDGFFATFLVDLALLLGLPMLLSNLYSTYLFGQVTSKLLAFIFMPIITYHIVCLIKYKKNN